MLALDGSDIEVCSNGAVISNVRFADDIGLLASSNQDLHHFVDKVMMPVVDLD